MTGSELRAIRMYNQISQSDFAYKLGYLTADTLRKVEKSDFVPHKYLEEISKMVRQDFSNAKILEEYLSKIPNEVHHKYKVYSKSLFSF